MSESNNDVVVVFIVPSVMYDNLGVGLLASCLNRVGFTRHRILPLNATVELRRVLLKHPRVIVAFSCVTPFVAAALTLIRKIKRHFPQACVIFGGPHATFSPEIINSSGIDGVCIGEGEEALVDFVQHYEKGGLSATYHLRNWWIKGAGGIVHKNGLRPVIADLDALPFAQRQPFPWYWFHKRKFRHFVFSMGCPYSCAFCSMPQMHQLYGLSFPQYYRVRTPASAIEEIIQVLRDMHDTGGSIVGMLDSVFGFQPAWLEEFAKLYERKVSYPFYCNAEARMVNADYVRRLKTAGCYCVLLGFETADDHLRQKVLRKQFDSDKFLRAYNLLRAGGIKVGIYNMIGISGSGISDDLGTYATNLHMRPNHVRCQIISLYPGTSAKEASDKMRGLRNDAAIDYRPTYPNKIRKMLERLECLFVMGVHLKVPVSVMRVLIRLPLTPVYRLIEAVAIRLPLYYIFCRFIMRRDVWTGSMKVNKNA